MQPFSRGNLKIISNGELYNHIELRRELKTLGHRFKTKSDEGCVAQDKNGYWFWNDRKAWKDMNSEEKEINTLVLNRKIDKKNALTSNFQLIL